MGMLPHRYPFLLIDRVLELDTAKSILALKNVTCNEPFFQGHFPNYRIMPGVLIIEALAQAGGVLLFYSLPDPEKNLVFLSKINHARFRKPVVPGDQLLLQVNLVKFKKGFCQIEAKALVDDEIVTEAEILASVVELEELYGKT
jgi:3-hydroxyacyl-[acyl-carrier-protein] dehydratase/UDP-3-O-[3-hydroxymyristoyl] N-acetylglucosamine deacetylase/3-hydroxyacyl-[acyl-carrier-protein] dehydratase